MARKSSAARMPPEAFLPLKPVAFHILVAIAGGHTHGYVIRQEVERRTEGRVRLWPATLYGTLAQLVEDGLLAQAAPASTLPDDDARRRPYTLTRLGRAVLDAETRRLEQLVRAARRSLLAGGRGNA